MRRGIEGQRFFKWALAYYFRFGTHVPGHTRIWEEFQKAPAEPMAGLGAIGTPEDVAGHLRSLEDVGVDQVIFLQQAASYEHDHICETLELLGREVLPEFLDRHERRESAKRRRLAPAIERALSAIEPLPSIAPEAVESYPVLWERQGAEGNAPGRSLDAASVWKLHVERGPGRS
jgi:hypothetical protein